MNLTYIFKGIWPILTVGNVITGKVFLGMGPNLHRISIICDFLPDWIMDDLDLHFQGHLANFDSCQMLRDNWKGISWIGTKFA